MRTRHSWLGLLLLSIIGCGGSDDAAQTPAGGDTADAGVDAIAQQDAEQPEAQTEDVASADAAEDGAGEDGGQPDSGSAASAAIAAYADALCNKFGDCAPFLVGYLYGDVQTCIARYVAGGAAVVLPDGAGVARTPQDLEQCAAAIEALSCQELYAGKREEACPAVAGTLDNGQDCFSGLQCASGFCDTAGDCGQCAPKLGQGEWCEVANPGCEAGFICDSPTISDPTTCMPLVGEGESCGAGNVCAGNLQCVNGKCAQPGNEGDSCTSADNSCNGLMGLRCTGSPPKCAAMAAFAQPGQACGIVGSSYVPCVGTAYCDDTTKLCVAKGADGTACEEGMTNACLYYASCVGGVCTVDSEPTCP